MTEPLNSDRGGRDSGGGKSPGIVRVLGASPEHVPQSPAIVLLKRRDGSRVVLRLKPASDAHLKAVALADAINDHCDALTSRLRTGDDTIITKNGPRHFGTAEAHYLSPPGHDDRTPSKVEIYGGPGSGELADLVVTFDLKHTTGYPDGIAVRDGINALGERLELLPCAPR